MCNMLNITGVYEFLQPSIYGLISYPKDFCHLQSILLGEVRGKHFGSKDRSNKKVRYELFWIKLCPFRINRHVAIGTMEYLGRGSPNHCLIRLIDIAKTSLSKFANILVSNT